MKIEIPKNKKNSNPGNTASKNFKALERLQMPISEGG